MRNLTRKWTGLFYNNRWSDGDLIIVGTKCETIIKPSRVQTRIVNKDNLSYVDGKSVESDMMVENRYFYNINDLKVVLERKVDIASMILESAKQNAFEEMKKLQKYFSKNGSPDGKEENK